MTWLNDHRNRAEHEKFQLADTFTFKAIPQADPATTIAGRLRRLKKSPQVADRSAITDLRPYVPSPRRSEMFPDPSIAHQTLGLGNYGESYRQFRAAFDSLPVIERTRLADQSNKAHTSYAKGEFREAAYQMRQAFQAARF